MGKDLWDVFLATNCTHFIWYLRYTSCLLVCFSVYFCVVFHTIHNFCWSHLPRTSSLCVSNFLCASCRGPVLCTCSSLPFCWINLGNDQSTDKISQKRKLTVAFLRIYIHTCYTCMSICLCIYIYLFIFFLYQDHNLWSMKTPLFQVFFLTRIWQGNHQRIWRNHLPDRCSSLLGMARHLEGRDVVVDFWVLCLGALATSKVKL